MQRILEWNQRRAKRTHLVVKGTVFYPRTGVVVHCLTYPQCTMQNIVDTDAVCALHEVPTPLGFRGTTILSLCLIEIRGAYATAPANFIIWDKSSWYIVPVSDA